MNKFSNFIQKFEKKLISKFQSEFKFDIDAYNGGTINFDKTMFKISMYKQVIGDRCEIQILCSHFDILFSKFITKARNSEAPYNHLISSTQLSVSVCNSQIADQLFLENQIEIVLSQLSFYFNKMNGLDYFSYNNIFNSTWNKVVKGESDDNIYACFQDQKFDFHVFYRKLFMSAMVGSLDYENILKLAWNIHNDMLLDWIKSIEPLDDTYKEILPKSTIELTNFDILLKNKNLEIKL